MRDFTDIKTMDDAAEVMVGARVLEFTAGRIVCESLAGERFSVTMTVQPVQVTMGPQNISFVPPLNFHFQPMEA